MFDIKLKSNIIDYCIKLCNNYDFGKRHSFNGTKKQQLVGVLGQCCVMDLFDLPLMKPTGFDGGIDLSYKNKTIDVKTMTRTVEMKNFYVHNLVKFQDVFNPDIYIFCSFNKLNQILTICGWVSKQQFLDRAICYKPGTIRKRADGTEFQISVANYEIKNNELNDVKSIEDLKNQIEIFN